MDLIRDLLAALNALDPAVKATISVTLFGPLLAVLLAHWLDRRKKLAAAENDSETPTPTIQLDPKHENKPQSLENPKENTLFFSQQADDFVGRTVLLQTFLDEFLDMSRPKDGAPWFRWALLYGDAGSGKSRFALELLKRFSRKYKKAKCGFADKDEYDSEVRISTPKIQNWNHKGPAFFVLDYAGSTGNLRDVIKSLVERAEFLRQPMRLLLLERKNFGEWADELKSTSDATLFLDQTRFDDEASLSSEGIGIKLRRIDDRAITEIIRKRIEAKRPLAETETDDYLIEQLDHFDEDHRPLFAAMVGEELAKSIPNTNLAFDQVKERNALRNDLLRRYITRERDEFWTSPADKLDGPSSRVRHENLLCLSTFCRGVPFDVLDRARETDGFELPTHESFEEKRYVRMTGKSGASSLARRLIESAFLPFLEPDFVGEWFVLQKIKDSYRGNVKKNFIQCGWDLRPEGVVQFVRQCHQNYPDEVANLDYLLPSPGAHIDQVAGLIRAVLAEWRATFDLIGDGAATDITDRHRRIAERAEQTFRLLKDHVEQAPTLSATAKANIAMATQLYINIQAYMISEKVRAQGSDWQPDTKRARPKKLTKYSLGVFGSPEEQPSRGRLRDENVFSSSAANQDAPGDAVSESQRSINTVATAAKKADSGEAIGAEVPSKALQRSPYETEGLALPLDSAIGQGASMLNDAASFFRTLAAQNPVVSEQMRDNASVFDQISRLLCTNPFGVVDDTSHTQLAGRLLADAATFFQQLALNNPPIQDQMQQNAFIFHYISENLKTNPLAKIPLGGGGPQAVKNPPGAETEREGTA